MGAALPLRPPVRVSSVQHSPSVMHCSLLQGGEVVVKGYREVHGPQFTDVFLITFVGAVVVTMNIKLLGGHMFVSRTLIRIILQLRLPMRVRARLLPAAAVVRRVGAVHSRRDDRQFVLRHDHREADNLHGGRLVGHLWCDSHSTIAPTFAASTAFLSSIQLTNRRALMIYPICLFYTAITSMIASHF